MPEFTSSKESAAEMMEHEVEEQQHSGFIMDGGAVQPECSSLKMDTLRLTQI